MLWITFDFCVVNAWEKRKLGDLGSVAMNKRIYKDQTSDEGEIPFYKIGSFGKQADAFISRKLFNEYKKLYPFPKKGDILISASGSIGRTIVYNGEDAYFQDSNIIWIQHDNRLDNTFLHQLFNIIRWSGVEGTTIKRLYNKNILSTQILLPSVEEQRSIGSLLDNVDNLIAATQDKLDSIEKIKKALLQHLFDQSMRFKGYSDPWEKRKFGELYSKTSEKNDGSFGPDKIISVATMSWKTNVRISNEGYLATYNVLRKGDIAFEGNRSKKFSFGRFVENDIGDGIVSHVFVVFRPKVPPVISYWKYFIHNEFVMRNILRKSTIKATMMTNLSSHDFLRQTLCTPSFKEQENIGNFLERLDSLIAATQSKLSSLETLKKALLQGLFI